MGKVEGKCHICGEYGPLTYEHVPPEKAFNSHKQFIYLGKEIIKLIGSEAFPWDFSELKRTQKQKGIGFYTLCAQCNNNTGSWYGSAFVDFIYKGYQKTYMHQYKECSVVRITFEDIYPLRIIKQILTMFFSINSPGLSEAHPELRAFILNKEKKGFPEEFNLYIYLARGSIARYIGKAAILKGIISGPIGHLVVSELSFPPFGSVLQFDSQKSDYNLGLLKINFFGNHFSCYDKTTVTLEMPVLECNTYFPCDYRTKDQVLEDYILNKMHELNIKRF